MRVEGVSEELTWSFNSSASSSALYACRRVTSTLIVAWLGVRRLGLRLGLGLGSDLDDRL